MISLELIACDNLDSLRNLLHWHPLLREFGRCARCDRSVSHHERDSQAALRRLERSDPPTDRSRLGTVLHQPRRLGKLRSSLLAIIPEPYVLLERLDF